MATGGSNKQPHQKAPTTRPSDVRRVYARASGKKHREVLFDASDHMDAEDGDGSDEYENEEGDEYEDVYEDSDENEDESEAGEPEAPKEALMVIKVTGLKECTSNDTLTYFFESNKRSGGGDIDKVIRTEGSSEAHIYFINPGDAANVLVRRPFILEGSPLEVSCDADSFKALDETPTEKPVGIKESSQLAEDSMVESEDLNARPPARPANLHEHALKTINDINEMFECPVCMDPFKDPRILPACGHHFCLSCLEGIAALHPKGNVTCPSCRVVTEIETVSSVKNLPKPLILNKVQAKFTTISASGDQSTDQTMCCDPCGAQRAEFYCQQCKEVLCAECKGKHSASKFFYGHEAVDISRVGFCDFHKGDKMIVQAFCHTCADFVCGRCILGAHETHNSESIITMAEAIRVSADDTGKRANKDIKSINAHIKRTEKEKVQRSILFRQDSEKTDKFKVFIMELESHIKKINNQTNSDRKRSEDFVNGILLTLTNERELRRQQITQCQMLVSLSDYALVAKRDAVPSHVVYKSPLDFHPPMKVMKATPELLTVFRKIVSQIQLFTPDLLVSWCGEATIQLRVERVSQLQSKDVICSDVCMIRRLPWRFTIKTRMEKGMEKCLSIFLQCIGSATSRKWSCSAKATIKIMSNNTSCEAFERGLQHRFRASNSSWGYRDFIPWATLLNPDKKWVRNDEMVVEAYVIADEPEGID